MGFFNRLQSLWTPSNMYRQPGMRNMLGEMDFMAWSGDGCHSGFCVDLNSLDGISSAYGQCSVLKTVVNRVAMAMANGQWWIVDAQDNDVSNKYSSIAKLFKRPNPLQTWSEFVMQLDVYRELYGEVFVYATTPVGLPSNDATSLWAVNRKYIEIETTGRLYNQSEISDIVNRYYFVIGGKKEEIDSRHILHIKDINQNLDFGVRQIRGCSRLTGLEYPIRSIMQAEEALYSINKDRGAFGILSNETKDAVGTLPLTSKEKEAIHKEYREMYGMSRMQRKILITQASLKWQPMSFNVKDLMLFEGMDKNIQMIASAFDYPSDLLGVHTASTFTSNSGKYNNESKKLLYQDNIIPISKIYAEKFTSFWQLDDGDKIIIDFSNVESIQTAEADAADTLSKKVSALHQAYADGAISREEYRLALGYDENVYGKIMYDETEGGQKNA